MRALCVVEILEVNAHGAVKHFIHALGRDRASCDAVDTVLVGDCAALQHGEVRGSNLREGFAFKLHGEEIFLDFCTEARCFRFVVKLGSVDGLHVAFERHVSQIGPQSPDPTMGTT